MVIAAWPIPASIRDAVKTTRPWPTTTSRSDRRPRRQPPRRAPPKQGRSEQRGAFTISCQYLYQFMILQKFKYLYKSMILPKFPKSVVAPYGLGLYLITRICSPTYGAGSS